MTECCITQYILLILPKPPYIQAGLNISSTNPLRSVQPRIPQPNTDISRQKKKKKKTLTTWFWSFYNDTRLPVEGLGQIWGGWKERGQSLQQTTGLVVAPGVKFIDFRQSHLHPYLRKHRCPFCREAQLMEKSAKWRETWVGGMAERATGREGRKKKKILLCKPDGFLWIKMINWWKKAGCSETAWGRE